MLKAKNKQQPRKALRIKDSNVTFTRPLPLDSTTPNCPDLTAPAKSTYRSTDQLPSALHSLISVTKKYGKNLHELQYFSKCFCKIRPILQKEHKCSSLLSNILDVAYPSTVSIPRCSKHRPCQLLALSIFRIKFIQSCKYFSHKYVDMNANVGGFINLCNILSRTKYRQIPGLPFCKNSHSQNF